MAARRPPATAHKIMRTGCVILGSRRAAVRDEWRAIIITAAHEDARKGWNVRPCAARYMMAAAAAVRPPSGDDLLQIVAMAEFYF
ncbi:hypothetical protein F511_44856 [Dorcoceras hygrometricum]|uniref:Uncharacterized protein n=1 Tax=Dorcoceras hygrometricum TaxID=472368 RepID=A0A2Z7ARC9_9LAMI|nr:hypothetical protein F511_44856 [Dorcoceras hygrometricum]